MTTTTNGHDRLSVINQALPLPLSPRLDDQEPFEGVSLELPFFSLRLGRSGFESSWEMNPDDSYERARRRVRARLGFYRHVAIYAALVAAIVFVDTITGGGAMVSLWIAGVWGSLLLWQGFNVFLFPSVWSQETEERMIQDELRRQKRR